MVKDDPHLQPIEEDKQFSKNLKIMEHILWEQNFYQLLKQSTRKEDMNLIFEVYEQWDDRVDLDDDNYSE